MANTPKIAVTIYGIKGGTLVKSDVPEEKELYVNEQIKSTNKYKKNKKIFTKVKKSIITYPLVEKPVQHHINMYKEAYDYMTSIECPSWRNPKAWKKLTRTQRLEEHLQRTCEHFGGASYKYIILED